MRKTFEKLKGRSGQALSTPITESVAESSSSTAKDGWKSFKLALAVLKEASAVFPPLQAATGGLLKVIEIVDQVSVNKENFKAASTQIENLSKLIGAYKESHVPSHVQDRIDGLTQSIKRRTRFIEERIERGLVGRLLNASDDANDITNTLREMAFAIELFQIDASISIEGQGRQTLQIVNDIHERELLQILDAVDGAPYHDGSRSECMDGTRVDTLTRLLAWVADPNSQSVCWLSGMAGIGKSAIAQSFCKMIDDGRLGGSFFCSRQAESLSNVSRILPTLAYQLAHQSQAYRQAMIQVLRRSSRRSYALAALQEQARDLFIGLAAHLKTNPLVVVIDALDECTGLSAVNDLLRVILRAGLPLKFLHIEKGFSSQETSRIDRRLTANLGFRPELLDHASLRLHDVENDIVEDDITRYLTNELSFIFGSVDEQNVKANIQTLAKKSERLFIFAFTAVQYISLGASANLSPTEVQQRLSIVLQPSEGRTSVLSTQTIDDLYQQIFVSAYSGKEKSEIQSLRASLDMVLCLREPQPVSVIAMLLGKQHHDVQAHLGNFRSALDIPEDTNKPVYTFHASFPDYILDSRRSGKYALDSRDQHQELALACLKVMNSSLHEDMCNIKRRQTRNADVSESLIREHIPLGLRYACVYWASHLTMGAVTAGPISSISSELNVFVNTHLLHWLECLSLIEALHLAFDCIQRARLYLSHNEPSEPDFKDTQAILLDVQYMIPQVHYFLKLHALEVYVSALAWLPVESRLRAKYARGQAPQILRGLDGQWGSCLQLLQSTGKVKCLAFSPNGGNLALGAQWSVLVFNLETGDLLKELVDHTKHVTSVAYSPNGSNIASGSADHTVRIWNADNGELEKVLQGHTLWVTSVAFSPAGSTLASGSDDKTVRIWNADTGELVRTLSGHTDFVTSIAFSPDGSKLASGSNDRTAQIWTVETGMLVKKLSGHTDWVRSVAFSLDGQKLASGSDDATLRIWNTDTGELIKNLSGHTDEVTSVSFSPDGSQLVSGSSDKTLRIWNAHSGELVREASDHTGQVTSVAFSPDGSILASGSIDKTSRIWNPNTGEPATGASSCTDWVRSVAFSPDGSKLASGSNDRIVRIWNANTGELINELLGHTDYITSLAFSPDGSKLVSKSDDRTVRLWKVDTGELVKEFLGQRHTEWVKSATFSPDGSKFLLKLNDRTVRTCNTSTGELITEPLGFATSFPNGHDIFKPTASSPYSLSHDRQCVVFNDAEGSQQPHLWIWGPSLQELLSATLFSQGKACLAFRTRELVILLLSDM